MAAIRGGKTKEFMELLKKKREKMLEKLNEFPISPENFEKINKKIEKKIKKYIEKNKEIVYLEYGVQGKKLTLPEKNPINITFKNFISDLINNNNNKKEEKPVVYITRLQKEKEEEEEEGEEEEEENLEEYLKKFNKEKEKKDKKKLNNNKNYLKEKENEEDEEDEEKEEEEEEGEEEEEKEIKKSDVFETNEKGEISKKDYSLFIKYSDYIAKKAKNK